MGKLLVIDGNSLLHRAFHALPPMNNLDGAPTQAVYGFLNMLLKILDQEDPSHLLVAFDTPAPTPRHLAYTEYKAGRRETADELRMQFPIIKEVLSAMHIAIGEKDGFEADDFLGIFSRRGEKEGLGVLLLTGDRDALQLITDKTTVILTKKGITTTAVMTEKSIEEEYGLQPIDLIEVKGLMGDASDNIPGIPGVGEKTAVKLIREYQTVENTILHSDEVSGKVLKEKIKTYADQARMSREIGIICVDIDAPIDLTIDDCVFAKEDMNFGRDILQKLGLRSVLSRLPEGADAGIEVHTTLIRPLEIEITDQKELQSVITTWESAEVLTIVLNDRLTVFDGNKLWCIPLQQDLFSQGLDAIDVLQAMKTILDNDQICKQLYDLKGWKHQLEKFDLKLSGKIFDAMIAAYLVDPLRSAPKEDELANEYTGLTVYDAFALDTLCKCVRQKLDEKNLTKLFLDIETPLIDVLYHMECIGFCIDEEVLQTLGAQYDIEIECMKTEIYELANEEFNILSPKQLGVILFDKLNLPVQRKTKTGYSTDVDTLEALADKHPIVNKVLEYRQLTKLKSTYIDGLLSARDASGRIHSQFHQNITATGRLSSTNPNLQNIPVRTEMGREIRKAFIASEGRQLVGADYSQIELRVLAHIADDQVMIDSFLKNEDIHARTAAEVAGCSLDQVTTKMRGAAKAVNFGIVYGISDFGLAKQLGITRQEANDYIQAYLEKYTGIRNYMHEIVEKGKADGYVETLFGRRRELPELRSKNHHTRSFGERAAMNAPIQGTAADIIKIAMNRTEAFLGSEKTEAQLILQVHDELIVDTPPKELEKIKNGLKQCMENVIQLKVPLVVDIKNGYSWYDTK